MTEPAHETSWITSEEQQALADASHAPLIGKKEVLKFPDWSGSTSENCSDFAD